MGTELLSLSAPQLHVCFLSVPECWKSQRAELQVQQQLSINSTLKNSTAGEKQIQCIKGGRGGEIYQDKSLSLFVAFLHFHRITTVQGRYKINQSKGFLI